MPQQQKINNLNLNQSVLKGWLILFVLVDHNDYIRSIIPEFIALLNFHVIGFLILPFLNNKNAFSIKRTADYFVRYYFPFLFFLALAIVINFVKTPGFQLNLFDAAETIVTGSMANIENHIGLSMLWFLPTLFSTVILLTVFNSLSVHKYMAAIFVALMFVLHVFISKFPFNAALPLGLGVSCYIFFLGFLAKYLVRGLKKMNVYFISALCFTVYFGTLATCLGYGLKTEVGLLEVPPSEKYFELALVDLLGLSGFLFFYYCSHFIKPAFIEWLGENSLKIYLVHPYFYNVFYLYIAGLTGIKHAVALFCISMMAAFVGCYFWIYFLKKFKNLDVFLFPANIKSYLGLFSNRA